MIVRIVPIVPVVSKKFETIGTTEAIAGFHMIVSIASKTEDWSLVDVVCQPIQITELCWRGDSITSRTRWNRPFFSQVSPIRGSDILVFSFGFSRVQSEFLSYCFPDIHSNKLILIVLTKFVINGRIFLHFFHKECRVELRVFCRHFEMEHVSKELWDSLRSSRSSQSSESVSIWSLQNLHDRPDRPDRTQLYPSDRGRLSRPGRLRSSR